MRIELSGLYVRWFSCPRQEHFQSFLLSLSLSWFFSYTPFALFIQQMSHKIHRVLYELLIARAFHHSSSFLVLQLLLLFSLSLSLDSLSCQHDAFVCLSLLVFSDTILLASRWESFWMGFVAQYVVFLCSCDIRILFYFFFHTFRSLYFSTISMLYIGGLSLMRPCVLRSLHHTVHLYRDFAGFVVVKCTERETHTHADKGEKKGTKHLSIYAIAKNNTFSSFFHILFFFCYVGCARFNDLFRLFRHSVVGWFVFFGVSVMNSLSEW